MMLEMHGRLFEVACTRDTCRHTELSHASPLAPALLGTEDLALEAQIPEQDLPRCSKCGALARPGVVWFGEMPRHLDEKVARLQLTKLGAELTQLSPEQAKYIGVTQEGPYKSDHYRY